MQPQPLSTKPEFVEQSPGRRCGVQSEPLAGGPKGDEGRLSCVRPHTPKHDEHYGATGEALAITWWAWR
jgi:hypothetical protein